MFIPEQQGVSGWREMLEGRRARGSVEKSCNGGSGLEEARAHRAEDGWARRGQAQSHLVRLGLFPGWGLGGQSAEGRPC